MSDRTPRMFNIDRHSMSILRTSRLSRSHFLDMCRTREGKCDDFCSIQPRKCNSSPSVVLPLCKTSFLFLSTFISIHHRSLKVSKQTMTTDETALTTMVLANSSLNAEQQVSHSLEETFSTSFLSLALTLFQSQTCLVSFTVAHGCSK